MRGTTRRSTKGSHIVSLQKYRKATLKKFEKRAYLYEKRRRAKVEFVGWLQVERQLKVAYVLRRNLF